MYNVQSILYKVYTNTNPKTDGWGDTWQHGAVVMVYQCWHLPFLSFLVLLCVPLPRREQSFRFPFDSILLVSIAWIEMIGWWWSDRPQRPYKGWPSYALFILLLYSYTTTRTTRTTTTRRRRRRRSVDRYASSLPASRGLIDQWMIDQWSMIDQWMWSWIVSYPGVNWTGI